jgi:transcriptional regulator with XRE-family HTH domain
MPHAVDVHVGKRVRQARWMKSMSQSELAERVGIKFQQIQKYEVGSNRVSASRLWDIAAAVEVDISFFFNGLESDRDTVDELPADLLSDREALEMVRTYYRIPEAQRRRLFDLAKVLCSAA